MLRMDWTCGAGSSPRSWEATGTNELDRPRSCGWNHRHREQPRSRRGCVLQRASGQSTVELLFARSSAQCLSRQMLAAALTMPDKAAPLDQATSQIHSWFVLATGIEDLLVTERQNTCPTSSCLAPSALSKRITSKRLLGRKTPSEYESHVLYSL